MILSISSMPKIEKRTFGILANMMNGYMGNPAPANDPALAPLNDTTPFSSPPLPAAAPDAAPAFSPPCSPAPTEETKAYPQPERKPY